VHAPERSSEPAAPATDSMSERSVTSPASTNRPAMAYAVVPTKITPDSTVINTITLSIRTAVPA
jgi:hypothetical protein